MFGCYNITQEDAASIGEPMAEVVAEYLPDKWLQTVATGADPLNCVIALYLVVTKTMGNETALVESYNERLLRNDQRTGQENPGKAPVGSTADQEPGRYTEAPETPQNAPADDVSVEAILAAADPSGVE